MDRYFTDMFAVLAPVQFAAVKLQKEGRGKWQPIGTGCGAVYGSELCVGRAEQHLNAVAMRIQALQQTLTTHSTAFG